MRSLLRLTTLVLVSSAVTLALSARTDASPRVPPLTAAIADAAIRALVTATTPDAVFPAAETPCPAREISVSEVGLLNARPFDEVLCIVAYHVGDTWGMLGAELSLVNGRIHVHVYERGTWVRKWAACPTLSFWPFGGNLESNNDCGNNAYGGDDWYFAGQLFPQPIGWILKPTKPTRQWFEPVAEVNWDWTNSAGYGIGGYTLASKHSNVYTYTDVIGDAFSYQP